MGKKEILAIIPARGGSKGIKHKNMVLVDGKPLIQYTIEAAKESRYITRAIVNSDDEEILRFAESQDIETVVRPPELAQDNTPMKDVICDQLSRLRQKENYVPDIILLLQPTSPLRTGKHIDEAMEKLIHSEGDALVSVIEEPHLHSPYSVMKLNTEGYLEFFLKEGLKFTSRQEKPKFYARNGAAIYAVYTDVYLKTGSLYGTKCVPYEMSLEDSVDIDDQMDLFLLKCMLNYKQEKMTENDIY